MLNANNLTSDVSSIINNPSAISNNLTQGVGSVTPNHVNDSDVTVIDSSWVLSRFMVPDKDLDATLVNRRYWSNVKYKFSSSALGNSLAINARPQFTRYADIRSGLSLGYNSNTPMLANSRSRQGGFGMGRYYSESIDDNQQLLYLSFGVPKFNSLLNFFTRAVSYEDSYIANHGRLPVGYTIGQFVGGVVMLAAFPLITVTVWAVKTITKLIVGGQTLDYYYMEPTMHTYWSVVNNIVTNLATEMGILIPEFMEEKADTLLKDHDGTDNAKKRVGLPIKINQNDMNELRKYFPTMISDNNYIDVFAIATRSQAIVNQQMLMDKEEYYSKDENEGFDIASHAKSVSLYSGTIANKVNASLSFTNFLSNVTGAYKKDGSAGEGEPYWKDRVNEITTTVDNTPPTTPEQKVEQAKPEPYSRSSNSDINGTYPHYADQTTESLEKFAKAFDSSFRDGGLFAIFNVDYVGSTTDSFSNSLGEIETGGMTNSAASAARNMKFNLAGGNIAGEALQDLIGAGKNFLMGAADSITFGLSNVVAGILGGGYIDMPKVWESSDASINQSTYSIQLVSPYGNAISQMQNIYIPLAMLLAGVLPLSTGGSSHTSPFICSAFSRGTQNIKLGMITSLTITRGTTNLPFNKTFKPLAIDVSFTISDFSNIVTLPVTASMFGSFQASFEDNSPLGKYISILGSRDIMTNKYFLPKIKLRASRFIMNKDQAISASNWGLRVGEFANKYLGWSTADRNLTGGAEGVTR